MNLTANIVNQFVDNENKIDKEKLRQYIQKELTTQLAWVTYWLHGTENIHKWNKLADYIAINDRNPSAEKWQTGLDRIMSLPQVIRGWSADHVDSEERLEFSIASKAAELAGANIDGNVDDMYDYFAALMIRHDQLLACVEVLKIAVGHLGTLAKLNEIEEIIKNPAFEWFCAKSLESYIYEMAQEVYQTRQSEN